MQIQLWKVISPGANTSFDVYFLSRELGKVESSLYINTNKGIIKFKVMGVGVENVYRLKPTLNARVPVNSSFTSIINFYNPHNTTLQILEIYTSDDDLHVELPLSQLEASSSQRYGHQVNTNNVHLYTVDSQLIDRSHDDLKNKFDSSSSSRIFNKQTKVYYNHNVQRTTVLDKNLWVCFLFLFGIFPYLFLYFVPISPHLA